MIKPFLITLFICLSIFGKGFAQGPIVSSFSPASGPVGTTITINGSNFNTTSPSNIVWFGATKATVIAATASKLTVLMPVGATYQPISVLNTATGLIGYSTLPFVTTFNSKHAIAQGDFDVPQSFATGAGTVQTATADMDGDGKIDVVAVERDRGVVSVFRNISTTTGSVSAGFFAPQIVLIGSGDPVSVTLGDLDGDGLQDIVVINEYSNKISIYINNSTVGNLSFKPPVDFTVGLVASASAVNYLAIADIDGDGKADIIAITNSEIEKPISVLRNTSVAGNLSFDTEVDFDDGTGNSSISVGDLDGDGLPDLVVTNREVSLFKNTSTIGNISFLPRVDLPRTVAPQTATLGDMDNDGKLDIVMATGGLTTSSPDNTVSVYRNISTTGSISFANPIEFASAFPDYTTMSLGDIDGDGSPDILIAAGIGIQIMRNNTTGNNISFEGQVNLVDGGSTPLISDINGDGKPDLVFADFTAFQVIQNDPQSTVVAIPPSVSSFTPHSGPVGTTVTISGANFNATPAANTVFFGATKAVVSTATNTQLVVKVPQGATYQPLSVLNTSTNLTGYSSIPFITTFPSGNKAANYDTKVDFTAGNGPNAVAVGDIDGDGKPDMVVVNAHSNSVSVYRNISLSGSITSASFAAKVDFTTPANPISVSIGDINGDGKPDLVIGCNGDNAISILRNTSGTGSITMAPLITFYQNGPVVDVKIADIDADGKPDIVGLMNDNEAVVYRNKSVGGNIDNLAFVKENLSLNTDTGPVSISIADIDGDGKPDIAVAVQGDGLANHTGSVYIFRNTSVSGNISFSSVVPPQIGQWPLSIGISDIDGDGKPDLVLTLSGPYNTNEVLVLPNTSTPGNITVGASLIFPTGNIVKALAIGDLDGDGKPDVAVTNLSDNTISVLSNTSTSGQISFSAKTLFSTGNYPEMVSIGDLDGDGKPDLITADALGNTVSVLHYNADATPAPSIISAYLIGASGTYIEITGLNLSGATAVTFGGIAATSFTVNSPQSITAIVGTGSTGDIMIVTPHGTASVSGFTFVPVPTITVSGPTVFEMGGNVLLTANPGTGVYTYQWRKDGFNINGATNATYSATVSGSYTVTLTYFSISVISAQTVKVNVTALPPNNFKLTITSATCKGSDNGSVNITAVQNLDYTATITGNGLNTPYPFTTTASIIGLAAGTYNVCITVAGQADYSQCYSVVITEPKDLSVYSTINPDNSLTLALSGADQYHIQLNGQLYTTSNGSITLPLTQGNNDLTVTTDRLCQGTFQKLINNSGNLIPYPVPFQSTLNLNLGNININNTSVEIHNAADGKLVYTKQYVNQSGVLQLDMTNLDNGVYVLHLTIDKSEKIFKIIKK